MSAERKSTSPRLARRLLASLTLPVLRQPQDRRVVEAAGEHMLCAIYSRRKGYRRNILCVRFERKQLSSLRCLPLLCLARRIDRHIPNFCVVIFTTGNSPQTIRRKTD